MSSTPEDMSAPHDPERRRFVAMAMIAGLGTAAFGGRKRAQRFTHVIVGAGSAGCVLARRLSDDPNNSVLLLEAGGAVQPPAVDIPSQWFGLSGTDIDWRFKTVAQAHADDRQLPVPRGKTLGGSSVINALIHHRGTPADYDRWEAMGAKGWGQAAMEPMFRRTETWLGPADPRRGTDGPMSIMPVEAPTPAAFRFIDGAKRAGHGERADVNADPGVGVSLNQLAFDGHHRMSSYRAYLMPVLDRPNLSVASGAEVLGLVLRGARCTAVRYVLDGEERSALVDKDVIVCAGAIKSPQLLMLSGIGPAADLARLGIKPVIDLPGVGQNLHEHLIFPGLSIETRQPFPPSLLMGTDAVLYAASNQTGGARDILLNFVPYATMAPGMESVAAGCKASFSFTKPKSRGRLGLVSADPRAAPAIDPNVLAHDDDLAGSRSAFEIAREILNGPAFAQMRLREVNPGPAVTAPDDIRAYLMRTGAMFGHSVGTCRMGTDAGAVVDPWARVRGTDNVRVVDASIIPEIPSAPTNATVLAIAEHASDLIAAG